MSQACAGCGLVTPTGTASCQAIFDELAARAWSDVAYGRIHRLAVDVYCLQHPDAYMESAKSAAVHILGVCAALEHENNPLIVHMIHKWFNGPSKIEKPAISEFRGAMTIADIAAAPVDPSAYARAVRNWARSTWTAYAPVHPFARQWLKQMMSISA
jgi:hypothetical protein